MIKSYQHTSHLYLALSAIDIALNLLHQYAKISEHATNIPPCRQGKPVHRKKSAIPSCNCSTLQFSDISPGERILHRNFFQSFMCNKKIQAHVACFGVLYSVPRTCKRFTPPLKDVLAKTSTALKIPYPILRYEHNSQSFSRVEKP
jgi:hypothetical protein